MKRFITGVWQTGTAASAAGAAILLSNRFPVVPPWVRWTAGSLCAVVSVAGVVLPVVLAGNIEKSEDESKGEGVVDIKLGGETKSMPAAATA